MDPLQSEDAVVLLSFCFHSLPGFLIHCLLCPFGMCTPLDNSHCFRKSHCFEQSRLFWTVPLFWTVVTVLNSATVLDSHDCFGQCHCFGQSSWLFWTVPLFWTVVTVSDSGTVLDSGDCFGYYRPVEEQKLTFRDHTFTHNFCGLNWDSCKLFYTNLKW